MLLPPLTTGNDLYVLPDGLVAYFLQDGSPRLTGIAVTRRPAVSMLFGPPELLIPDTGPKVFDSPVVTPDELTMFLGGEDGYPEHIYVATRARVDEPVSDPVPVHELDSSGGESPSWISPDGCRLYFTRNVLEAGTTARVYVASRPVK